MTRAGLSTGYPQPLRLSTVYPQSPPLRQNLSTSPLMLGILAPYPISAGGSHGLSLGSPWNIVLKMLTAPSWLFVDIDEQPWSNDNDSVDIMMPLDSVDSLDTMCLDLSLYCIYIIAHNEDMSTTFYTVYTAYLIVEAPHPSLYSIRE